MKQEIKEKIDSFLNESNALRKEIDAEIVSLLISTEKKRVDFDYGEDEEQLVVTYDGGSHPERNNAFSVVDAVYLNVEGEVMLSVEEDGEYPLKRVAWINEAMCVLEFVDWKVNG